MKTAIIGLGVIGNVHANILAGHNVDIVALCDINTASAENTKERLNLKCNIYSDFKKMLSCEKIDVVHICCPHYLHAEMIIYFLSKDVNVLSEKPLCISLDELNAIIKAEIASKAILGVCHQNRYNATSIFAKEFIKDKKVLGGYANVVWHRDEKYYKKDSWRGKWKTEGGGVLINQALHTLDLLQWFAGMPESLSAVTGTTTLNNTIEVEDSAVINCYGDKPFSFFATVGAFYTYPVEINLMLEDKNLLKITNAYVNLNGKEIFCSADKDKYFGKSCYGVGHEGLFEDFYKCVNARKKFSIDGAEAGKVIKLILASYKSNGEKIRIEEDYGN